MKKCPVIIPQADVKLDDGVAGQICCSESCPGCSPAIHVTVHVVTCVSSVTVQNNMLGCGCECAWDEYVIRCADHQWHMC